MKYLGRLAQTVRDRTPFLRRDSIRLATATAVVGGALFGIYSVTARPAPVLDEATIAARQAEEQRQEALALRARRTGTILFVTYTRLCEERRFDNTTGYTVGIDQVECDERLGRDDKAKADGSQAKNMQGMLASFKR